MYFFCRLAKQPFQSFAVKSTVSMPWAFRPFFTVADLVAKKGIAMKNTVYLRTPWMLLAMFFDVAHHPGQMIMMPSRISKPR